MIVLICLNSTSDSVIEKDLLSEYSETDCIITYYSSDIPSISSTLARVDINPGEGCLNNAPYEIVGRTEHSLILEVMSVKGPEGVIVFYNPSTGKLYDPGVKVGPAHYIRHWRGGVSAVLFGDGEDQYYPGAARQVSLYTITEDGVQRRVVGEIEPYESFCRGETLGCDSQITKSTNYRAGVAQTITYTAKVFASGSERVVDEVSITLDVFSATEDGIPIPI